jgi:hypothetical protein
MLFYRYLNEQFGLLAIQTGELKVGRLAELNDPADCLPIIANSPESGDDAAKEAFEKRYFSQVYNDVGILCFSATLTDPVIWSHYADSHRGMALGYEFGGRSAKMFEVKYADQRAVLDYNETERDRIENPEKGKFIESVVTKGFTKKALSWQYEKEYRIFVNLYHSQMKGPHYFVSGMRPQRVVLGLKCRVTESDVIRMVRHAPPSVARAKMDRERHCANYQIVDIG